jgi:DNA polymerase-3 subunit epsilon
MKPIVFYDLETTGIDVENSRIVQIAMLAGSGEVLLDTLVQPGCPIPAGASAVHGITDEAVASSPPFAEIAAQVQGLVEGVVLAGYNSRRFDAPLLDAELRRAGQPGLDFASLEEIDLYAAWAALEPRTLVGAVRRFLNKDLEGAHSALHDVRATQEVMGAMAALHGLEPADFVRLSRPEWEVDRDGKFRKDEATGTIVFAFGKYQGQPASEHADYLRWMLSKDFPPSTQAAIRRILEQG